MRWVSIATSDDIVGLSKIKGKQDRIIDRKTGEEV
jgi:hypothetical protein